mmetsp:Transcript_97192/g.313413  ORF Transcript_97192/g.313413 Transcript_97192/m.313413 type:complete len:242 (-) Transcript_97192:3-728(-)
MAPCNTRRPQPSISEQELADGGLGLLKHEAQTGIDGVVDGDLASLAGEDNASQARGPMLAVGGSRQLHRLVEAQLAGLRRASLGLDDPGVLRSGGGEALLDDGVVAGAAADLHLVLQEHQQTLHDELRDELAEGLLVLQLRLEHALGVVVDQPDDVLPGFDLLQPGPVDGGGASDGVLGVDLLRLALVLVADLLLGGIDDLQLLDTELLQGLRADLLRLVLGLVQDELSHLKDLVLVLSLR